MADPQKRIVVDGIDFAGVFYFPRILRSVTSAMQPPRLIVALLMVVLLVVFGRVWDANTEANISPDGLLAGEWTALEKQQVKTLLWEKVRAYGVSEQNLPPEGSWLDAREVLGLIERAYRHQRQQPGVGARGDGDAGPGLPPEQIQARDARFLADRTAIQRVAPKGVFAALAGDVTDCFQRTVKAVIYLRPQLAFDAWSDLFIRLPLELWRQERVFTIAYGIFFLIVMAVGGGALSRMAACDLAGQERLRVRDAFDFSLGNWVKLVLTPLLPLIIAAVLTVIIILLGLFMAPWLDLAGGLLYGVAMVLGFVLAFTLLAYAVGFPMLLPAVACENCDPADAQQRAFAYVLKRPLHLVGYVLIALIGLALGYVVVALVAATMMNFTASLFGAFTGNSAMSGAGGFGLFDLAPQSPGEIHESWHNSWAAAMIFFWQRVVIDLVVAYVIAYLFTASTALYLLMRRACDGQDIEEIWVPGLTPGTLVPLPRPHVQPSAGGAQASGPPGARKPDVAERVITGAMRTATTVRFGSDDATDEESGGEEADAAGKDEAARRDPDEDPHADRREE
ncbi:MAG: hypothetical protein SYC29_06395 [Planctomycetota bacterium]|nr:hypothetical protein [Planctomycetota bacterium]